MKKFKKILSWNENTYDDIYPLTSVKTGSHFGGAVLKTEKNNFYLAGGYSYGNVSKIELVKAQNNTGKVSTGRLDETVYGP